MKREEVIQMLEAGVSLKKISDTLDINYNTVRQISVSNRLLKKFSYLDREKIDKLRAIGNNIRALASIKDDEEAITTLIDSITPNTTRKELEEWVSNIKEIKNEKNIILQNYQIKIDIINDELKRIKERIKKINDKDNVIKELELEFKFVRDIKDKDIRKGYLNLIGLRCDSNRMYYALARIININLWNKLRRAKAIKPGTNEILDMEKFVELTQNTIKRNNYYKYFEKAKDIIEIKAMTVANQLKPYLEDLDEEIIKYNRKIDELKEEMKKASSDAMNNYFAERELRNEFTKNDSITHAKIQQGGAKWLFNKGYVATIELPADKFKFDVIAYNREEEIVILEAKANYSDLVGDKKIEKYMKYCDKLYLVSNDDYICDTGLDILDKRIGIIKLNNAFAFQEVLREAENLNNGKKELIYEINRKNSRKLIY